MTEYHLEAAIASMHAVATSVETTDWATIVNLYDVLMRTRPSPVVALSRAIAVGLYEGPERGLAEIDAITGLERLREYPFFVAARGEFDLRCGRTEAAHEEFSGAMKLARNPAERRYFERCAAKCGLPVTD
ncbi:MAG: hypothetical protein ACREK8_10740 [Gemmatimonadales bacterium]